MCLRHGKGDQKHLYKANTASGQTFDSKVSWTDWSVWYSDEMQRLWCQDEHPRVASLKPKDRFVRTFQRNNMLVGHFWTLTGLPIDIHVPGAVTKYGKLHVRWTAWKLAVFFWSLDVPKCIESTHMCPAEVPACLSCRLPKKCIHIVAYAEHWRQLWCQHGTEKPLVAGQAHLSDEKIITI